MFDIEKKKPFPPISAKPPPQKTRHVLAEFFHLSIWIFWNLGVSKNRGTPKWMVYNGKPHLKWMIWGYPYFWKPPPFLPTAPKTSRSTCHFHQDRLRRRPRSRSLAAKVVRVYKDSVVSETTGYTETVWIRGCVLFSNPQLQKDP